MQELDKVELSAFFDDESADAQRVAAVLKTPEGREAWARQCAIRDAIRGESLTGQRTGLVDSVSRALADEPVVLNPAARHIERPVGAPVSRNRQFAGLALAATVAGVAFLGLTQFDDGVSNQVAGGDVPGSVSDFPPMNGIGGAVVAEDVRPVTRLILDDEETEDTADGGVKP